MIRFPLQRLLAVVAAALFLGACATHTVKTTSYTPVISDSQNVPEELLLDVGIAIFDPGLDEIKSSEEETTNHQIRVAESRYAPYLLAETLQRSGNWGIVRLMPIARRGGALNATQSQFLADVPVATLFG